jgi:glycosyltransferase involved in cell wall biosynthesis
MSIKKEFIKVKDRLASLLDSSSLSNPDQPTIAVNIICKNNENCIELALASCMSFADEIIVVDTGSTDSTLAILKKYSKVKVIAEAEFKGYSYHRNQAIKSSTSDWILIIDSDEFVGKKLQDEFKNLAKTKIYSAYRFYYRWVSHLDNNSATYHRPVKKIKGRFNPRLRFFRRLANVRYEGEIHEAVFGLETKRIKDLSQDLALYHLDVLLNSFETRSAKALARNKLKAGAALAEEYLPELFKMKNFKVPDDDQQLIRNYLNQIELNNHSKVVNS